MPSVNDGYRMRAWHRWRPARTNRVRKVNGPAGNFVDESGVGGPSDLSTIDFSRTACRAWVVNGE